MSYVNFLIQLTEKDKRLLIALFIILIVVFVLIAYVGQGLKALMKRYGKGIDGYMHDLCKAKLVTNPSEFRKQVFKKETRVLYRNTRWVFRAFIVFMAGFIAYTFIAKPGWDTSPDSSPFAYVGSNIRNLFIDFEWPKGEFFGIKNFPIDWPYIAKGPSPEFTLPAIVSYVMLLVWIFTFFGLFTSTLKFIARIHRANVKSRDVFTKSLDDVSFIEE